MGFKDELKAFEQVVLGLQASNEREYITDEEAVAAINILNVAQYNKVPDVFLGCAAFNLLNVYVKQKNNMLSCNFHRHIHNILKGVEDVNQPKTIKVSFDSSDNLSLLIVAFWGFQFSFQSMRLTDQVKALSKNCKLVWDGIRKQKCAATIFKFAYESTWISNKTLGGECLRDYIDNEIEAFLNGDYAIEDGRFVKVKNITPAMDDMDHYLKNYIREKLYACQDRPVILSAVFRRIWDKHITFTSVKPYIPNTRVITICDHINLYRKDVEKVIDISTLQPGRRYYIIGYCRPYKNVDRMGVQLDTSTGVTTIFGIKEFEKMPVDIMSKCHRFSIEEYLSAQQEQLKL